MGKVAEGEQQMYRKNLRQSLRVGLAILVVLALSACAAGGGGQEQANKPRPLPEVEKALRPGSEYRTEEFKPSFSFSVGEGWSMETDPPEGADELEITWRRGTMNLFILNEREVYKPARTGTPAVVDAPKDMVGWFRHHPYLNTEEPEPVAVGGIKGVQLDLVVEDPPQDYHGNCATQYNVTDCVDIVPISTPMLHPLAFEEGIKERVTLLEDVKGEPLMIDFGASEAKFGEFAPEGQKVVESMKWTGS
jgi:hypothetical protein